MRTRLATIVVTLAFVSFAAPAFALRPDFDGERGIEATFSLGYGTFTDTSARLLTQSSLIGPTTMSPNLFNGGPNVRFGVGYRLLRCLSAGFSAQVQLLDAQPDVNGAPASGNAYAVGFYARFYPAPLLNGSAAEPRVRLDRVADGRRLDPWISVGVEFVQQLNRTTYTPGTAYYSTWTRNSVGVPLGVGLDVRVLPGLAVGVSFVATPWAGGAFNLFQHRLSPTGNDMDTSMSYQSADSVNVAWTFGLDARYTFSL